MVDSTASPVRTDIGPAESASDGGRPRVDVCVVTWNTASLTAEALRRLLDGEQACDLRVLVHDNASADGTPEVLEADVPEAEVEVGDRNVGFAAGMNRAIARSTAPYVFVLNADAWPEPGTVAALVRAAEAHQRAALVAPRVLRPNGDLEHSTHPFPTLTIAALYALGGSRLLPTAAAEARFLEPAWRHDRARSVDWAVGAAWLVRRAALEAIGPLDERYFMYAEDIDWCWRARRAGWDVWFDPAAVVRHVGDASGSQVRDQSARAAMYLRNTNTFVRLTRGRLYAGGYRALNVVGCLRLAVGARMTGRADRAAFWWTQARVHLGRDSAAGPW